eukprot:2756337-Amphidinium_carterae.2
MDSTSLAARRVRRLKSRHVSAPILAKHSKVSCDKIYYHCPNYSRLGTPIAGEEVFYNHSTNRS